MIDPKRFLEFLQASGVGFFTGVPDSHLNGFCNYLRQELPGHQHVIAANEGNAVAIAAGHYFKSGTLPLVYMQNSGLGNTVNPLASLTDRHVFSVPLVLLIGWRGEPGTGDWAQHVTQGRITTGLLDLLDIPYVIAEDDADQLEKDLAPLLEWARSERRPVAIIGRKGVFSSSEKENIVDDLYPMSREEAIEILLDQLPEDTIYAATTGRATRELYFLRDSRGESHAFDFLNVGAMGHTSSVALGLSLAAPDRQVVCLDGDSAAIMHLGALAMAEEARGSRFLHVILNNGAHESVGGQPSAGYRIDFTAMAKAAGYRTSEGPAKNREDLVRQIGELTGEAGPAFIDVRIHKGMKGSLPPLDIDHLDLVNQLMDELQKEK